ncbi:hypothetical protein N7519_003574 [Penicillium mononematosum]|uniref:uncharacterized protein n=1 Tax=Penicillium mononematosum TaxID=268346 RepID=UPI002547721E|nr:uncharacterized protein N7519_003574 [Penicillium mononematosum]KAJ6188666.1 hypothetical protein N7519_003574 [Penicillium mononematosum]
MQGNIDAKMDDEFVYGVATDSFEWVFIHFRANSQYINRRYKWHNNSVKIVPLLYMTLEIAAGSSILSPNDHGQLKELTKVTKSISPISRAKEDRSGDITHPERQRIHDSHRPVLLPVWSKPTSAQAMAWRFQHSSHN